MTSPDSNSCAIGVSFAPGLKNWAGQAVPAYDGDVFDLLNSWGKDLGRNGHWFVTSKFIANAFDMWALDIRRAS